jgi:hypothetical protein
MWQKVGVTNSKLNEYKQKTITIKEKGEEFYYLHMQSLNKNNT